MADVDKHIFAVHVPTFWNERSQINLLAKITDQLIVHRLVKVLRIETGQRFIFFDQSYHGMVQIMTISKKDITVNVISFENNKEASAKIIFLLPLLKKEALEEAVYSLCEIGVSEIQLVVTQKSRQKLLHEKEFHRLESIIIAAAEQSKNYLYPKIHRPTYISSVVFDNNSLKVVFDPEGQSFFDIQKKASLQEKIYLLVGPEGGLTVDELNVLSDKSFIKCHLTSTILRAVQAVVVGLALFKI